MAESDLGLRILAVKSGMALAEIKGMIQGGLLDRCQRIQAAYVASGWPVPAEITQEPWSVTAPLIHRLREPRLRGDERLRIEGRLMSDVARWPSVLVQSAYPRDSIRRAHRTPQLYRGWQPEMDQQGYEMVLGSAEPSVMRDFCRHHLDTPQWQGFWVAKQGPRFQLAARIAWQPRPGKTISTVLLGPSVETIKKLIDGDAGVVPRGLGERLSEGSLKAIQLGDDHNPIRPAPAGDDYPIIATAKVLGSDECDHPDTRAFWSLNHSHDAVHLNCQACDREQIMVVPLHRIPEGETRVPFAARMTDWDGYLKAQAFYDAMEGIPPARSIEELQKRDGLIRSWEPSDYAITAQPRRGAGVSRVADAMNRR